MKLIILNYHFPPDPSMGGRRWAGLGKYLARRGAEIHVVTSGPADETERRPDGVVVHRRSRRRTLNDLYLGAVAKQGRQPPKATARRTPDSNGKPESTPGLLSRLRGELSALLVFPDYSRGWALKALRATVGIARGGGVTGIVSSGPPHSTHLVGSAAAISHRIPHIVDLRDPWATHRMDPDIWTGIHRRRIWRLAMPTMERFTFGRADLIIANTRRLRALLRAHHPSAPVEWVPNGIDLEEVDGSGNVERFPGLSIAYAGTLYGGRTFDAVLEAFRDFLARRPEARKAGSRIRIAGNMDARQEQQFLEMRKRYGLEDVVQHLGVLSRKESVDLARASTLALVLAQDQELQVPGKIYELAAVGHSILVIAERDSASADEASRLGLHWCDGTDTEAMLQEFERGWSVPDDGTDRDLAAVSYESIADTVEVMLADIGPTRRRNG